MNKSHYQTKLIFIQSPYNKFSIEEEKESDGFEITEQDLCGAVPVQ